MRLLAPVLCSLLSLPFGCDSPKTQEGGTTAASASKPAVQVVVRAVELATTISRHAAAGGGEDESWSALEGKAYAVVTADLVHNQCAAGDKITTERASLVLAGGAKAETTGGGVSPDKLCVLCAASDAVDCRGGVAAMRPFTFVFSVPASADLSKAKLHYGDQQAPLSDAKIVDKRGNEKLDRQIQAKQDEIKALKKKLENTGSQSAGKIILSEIDAKKGEIAALEKQRK